MAVALQALNRSTADTKQQTSSARMYHVMHIESSPEAVHGNHVSVGPPLHPPHLFLESSPGETVQCLNRSILIHDTTFEQKNNIFIFFYQGAKKKKEKTLGFLSFPVLHSDFATFDVFFCHKEATMTTRLDGKENVCWLLK